MLKIKPNCEHCNTDLPFYSEVAMFCTFECTFCSDCVTNVLHQVCPNCEGGFTIRPIRPVHLLEKYPISTERIHKPVDQTEHLKRISNPLNHYHQP